MRIKLLTAALVAVLMAGCSGDDDNEPTAKDMLEKNIVGTWVLNGYCEKSSMNDFDVRDGIVYGMDIKFDEVHGSRVMQFNADGTFTALIPAMGITIPGWYHTDNLPRCEYLPEHQNIHLMYDTDNPHEYNYAAEMDYRFIFFEPDFSSAYFVHNSAWLTVSRYDKK